MAVQLQPAALPPCVSAPLVCYESPLGVCQRECAIGDVWRDRFWWCMYPVHAVRGVLARALPGWHQHSAVHDT